MSANLSAILLTLFRLPVTPALRIAGEERLLRLDPDELATLRIGTIGRLVVLRGRAWVTIDGEPADHFIGRGESLALQSGCVVRIGGDARIATLVKIATSERAGAGEAGPGARAARWLREHVHRGSSWAA